MKRIFLAAIAVLMAANLVAQDVNVMSFNLRYDNEGDKNNRWDLRKEVVVECINEYAPDVFGTQEGLANQIKYLEGALPKYKRVGIAREDGKEKGEHSAVFYNTDRFELISSDNSWLSETPDTPSLGWDAECIRITTTAVLKDKKNGKILHFINTHFDHVGKEARRQSPRFILDRVAKAGDDGVIFTGDLNAAHSDEPIEILLNDGKLKDSYLTATTKEGPNFSFHGFKEIKHNPKKDAIIDFIMYNKSFTADKNITISKKYNDRFVSDHYPIFAILKYK